MAQPSRSIDLEVRRLRRRLQDLVDDSDVPRWRVDDRLGHAKGYLSQLLAGTIDLRFSHLIGVLDAIGCPPRRFFHFAFPPRLASGQRPRRYRRVEALLRTDPEVVAVYALGIETVRQLGRRLERCERALEAGDLRRSQSRSARW